MPDDTRLIELHHVEYETENGAAAEVVLLVDGKPVEHKVERFEYRIDESSGRGTALLVFDLPSVKLDVKAPVTNRCGHCGHEFEFETRAEWVAEMRLRGVEVPGEKLAT